MTTHAHLILDMTGSMMSRKQATIDAINEYIEGLKADPATADFRFSLSIFNSNIGVERIIDARGIGQVRPIAHEQYRPDGATPLYDAIGSVIDAMSQEDGAKLVIIQTDGEENSSRHYKKSDIVQMVQEKTKEGWQFVYLGCELDAMQAGAELGIAPGNTMMYLASNARPAFSRLGLMSARYARSGSICTDSFFEEAEGGTHADPTGQKEGPDGH